MADEIQTTTEQDEIISLRHALNAATAEVGRLHQSDRALRQALTWCVVNNGETLGDHPRLLGRFREILGMEVQTDA